MQMALDVASQHPGCDMLMPALFARAANPDAVPPEEEEGKDELDEGEGEGGIQEGPAVADCGVCGPDPGAEASGSSGHSSLIGTGSLSELA